MGNWTGRRQSTNVQTAQEAGLEAQTSKAMNSKTLRDPQLMRKQPLEKTSRVGVIPTDAYTPTSTDAQFLPHFQKNRTK
jgi:hypothetical protein